jgi:hypothetical protein
VASDVAASGPGRGDSDAGLDGDLDGVGSDGNRDGLAGVGQADPNQQYDPQSCRYWSYDVAHYPPLCAAH